MKRKGVLIAVLMVSCILITVGVITDVKNYISKLNTAIQYTKDESIVSTITIENIKSIKITAPRAEELGFFLIWTKKNIWKWSRKF